MRLHLYTTICYWLASLCLGCIPLMGFDASTKGVGMGFTGIAYPQDALAAAYNPAGAVLVCNRFDLGFGAIHYEGWRKLHGNLFFNGNFRPFNTRDKHFYSPNIGLNKMVTDDLSIGFVFYNRNQIKTKYHVVDPLFGRTHPGLEYEHETLSPYVSFRYCQHSFGVSLNYMYQRAKFQGVQNFDNILFSSVPGHVTNRGYSYSTGVGVTLGWLWRPHEMISIGVTYQPKTKMSRFRKYRGLLAEKGRFDIPELIGAGVAFHPCNYATFTFDVLHVRWKGIRSLHNALLPNLFIAHIGSSHGAGFGWKNQMFYRLGFDYHWNACWAFRAGFEHTRTPIRRSQTAVNSLTLATNENTLTLGGTWSPCCAHEFSFAYVHGFKHKIKGNNSIPLLLGGGEDDIERQYDALSLSWGWLY